MRSDRGLRHHITTHFEVKINDDGGLGSTLRKITPAEAGLKIKVKQYRSEPGKGINLRQPVFSKMETSLTRYRSYFHS